MFGFLAAAATKFAGAGAVAQAATGLSIALVSVTGAAATGVLPDGVQDHVSSVLQAVTPFGGPNSDDTSLTPAQEETVTSEQDEATFNDKVPNDPGQLPDISETAVVTPEQAEFGQNVSTDAQDGGVDGGEVSSDARATHQPVRPDTPSPAQPETGRPESAPSVPAVPDQASDHGPAEAGRP